MKLKWLGHSCFEITLNNGKVFVTDPYDETVGYPPLKVKADVVLSSHDHFDHNYFAAIEGDYEIVNQVGAYERFGAKITGVHSYHDEVKGAKRGENVIFTLEADGVRLTHLGDLGHLPETEEQKAAIRGADVLLIPMAGTFTITTPEAIQIIEAYKPVAAIAMHYANRYCGFPVTDCKEFVERTSAVTCPTRSRCSRARLRAAM
ncbi:MAG: MBL fold metallo-hydrolase [Clostridia bacterium]|nr:MBL fold metallo-hydrolase [Clostridia bacterium]